MAMDYRKKKEKGFVVLIAVMVTTIILTVSMGVLDLALREFVLANLSRESVRAFYAADTGIECAFNYDVAVTASPQEPYFATPFASPGGIRNPGTGGNSNDTLDCNGQQLGTQNKYWESTTCDGFPCIITYVNRSNQAADFDGNLPENLPEAALCLDGLNGTTCTGACVTMEVRKIQVAANRQRTEILANGVNDCDGDRRVERSLLLTWE